MIRRIVFPIFILSIVIWISFAAIRTFGYLNTLLFIDLEKAGENNLVDNDYSRMLLLAKNIKESDGEVFVYSTTEGRDFFLLRYLAYPKKVYWYEEGRYPHDTSVVYITEN